jgi:hypothetical protein
MAEHRSSRDEPSVPGTGGAPVSSRDGQQALRLHAGIATIAFVLCAFVTGVFFWLGSPVLAVIFAVLALACLAALGWAIRRRRSATSRRQ